MTGAVRHDPRNIAVYAESFMQQLQLFYVILLTRKRRNLGHRAAWVARCEVGDKPLNIGYLQIVET